MNRLLLTAVHWARSPQVHGVAGVVAPRHPMGRLGSAVAVTAALIGVQLGLLAAHAGSDLCRAVSACRATLGAHGAVPETRETGGSPAAPARRPGLEQARGSSAPANALTAPWPQPQTAAAMQTVAFRTSTPVRTRAVTAAPAKRPVVVKGSKQTSTRHAPTTVLRHIHRHHSITAARRTKVHRRASVHRRARTHHHGLARGRH